MTLVTSQLLYVYDEVDKSWQCVKALLPTACGRT